MLRSLHLSPVGRLSLALAVFLALVATGALTAARRSGGSSASPVAPGAVYAQGVNPPAAGDASSGLVVIGEGDATASPDVAFLTLGVQSDGKTAREALDANSTLMAAVIDAVKRAGIPDNDLRTTGISLTPQFSQPRPGDQSPPQVVGYRASNSVAVTVENVARAGDVLDVAVSAGANVAGGVRFGIKDDAALRRRALEQAGQIARAKADALAGSLGLRVTGVRSVVEESSGTPAPLAAQGLAAADRAAPAPPVQSGELTLHVRVRVTFSYA